MKRNAFTLVELLVVIGIIALLIAILLPSLNRARDSAQAVQCSSNMRQIGQTMLMYVNDYNLYIPMYEDHWQFAAPVMTAPRWTHVLAEHGYIRGVRNGWTVTDSSEILRCPSDTTATGTSIGSGVNNVSYIPNHSVMPSGGHTGQGPFRITQFRHGGAQRLWLTEKNASLGQNQSFGIVNQSIAWRARERTVAHHGIRGGDMDTGNMNVLFLDGHVETMRRVDVIEPILLREANDPDPDPTGLWGTRWGGE
jgi:prepilin-type N-terminal cleavage/methylation domain-containing protein/prepilin-type processing-associated H-X9-DG protein